MTRRPHITTRLEFMLTLECSWGCRDCCRGLESAQPKNSHVTPEQLEGYFAELRRAEVYVSRIKIHGGEPVKNPDFEQLILMFAAEVGSWQDGKLFRKIKVQTAYPRRAVLAKYNIPWNPSDLVLHCEPVDDRKYKGHHIPWFVSPQDVGLLAPSDTPPEGTALTERACELQKRCGRSFERWGFTACAQESVIGRVLGIDVYSQQYKHWGDPRICRHCPYSLGKQQARELQERAMRGEIPRVTESLRALEATPENIVQLQAIYQHATDTPIWQSGAGCVDHATSR